MNLSIVSARYVAPLKVELHFNDDTVKTIDVGAFIRNHPHPQYNSYLNENKFKIQDRVWKYRLVKKLGFDIPYR